MEHDWPGASPAEKTGRGPESARLARDVPKVRPQPRCGSKEVERAALSRPGIDPLQQRATKVKTELDQSPEQLTATYAALAEIARTHGAAEDSSPHEQANELLAKSDAARDSRTLMLRRRTPSHKDEAVLKDQGERAVFKRKGIR
jgi:hypothetical protein